MSLLKNLFIVLLFLFFLSLLTRNVFNYRNQQLFKNQYQRRLADEKKRQIVLQTEILKKKDRTEIEKTGRNKLNLSSENEIVIILPPPSPTPVIITPSPLPNWKQWWQLFFYTR